MAHAGEWAGSKIDASPGADETADTHTGLTHGPTEETVAPSDPETPPRTRLSSSDLARMIVRGGAWSLLISATGAALSLGVHLVLARILGGEEYGRYVFALAWMNVLLLVGKFELETASVRFVGA